MKFTLPDSASTTNDPAHYTSEPIEDFAFDETTLIQGSTCKVERFRENGQTLFRKILKPELADKPHACISLKKEFEIGSSLDSIYLPRYVRLEYDEMGNAVSIVMENIEGRTLEEMLTAEPDYFNDKTNLQRFLTQLCEGLAYLHEHQIVHLDLQPRNIMLTQVGHDVRIIDLGYSYSDCFQTSCGSTPAFSANDERPDCRSDIYSIGRIVQHISTNSAQPLPSAILKVADKCAAPQPEDRYDNIEELQRALHKVFTRKRRMIALSITALLLCGITLGIWAFTPPVVKEFTAVSKADEVLFRFKVINEDSAWVSVVPNLEHPYDDSMTIPDSVEHNGKTYTVVEVSDSCFNENRKITIITLPSTIRRIGIMAAYNCTDVSLLNIPEGITHIDKRAFHGCKTLRELRLPTTLRKMSIAAFARCDKLTDVIVPEGMTDLEQDVFAECPKLQNVHLPSTLKHIHRGVFWRCRTLRRITIPAAVNQMDELIFFDCDSLREVTMLPTTPPRAIAVFKKLENLTIYVPAESLEAYQRDPYWGKLPLAASKD